LCSPSFPFVVRVDLEYYFLLAVLIESLQTTLFQYAGTSFFICEPLMWVAFPFFFPHQGSLTGVSSSSRADSGCDFPVHAGQRLDLILCTVFPPSILFHRRIRPALCSVSHLHEGERIAPSGLQVLQPPPFSLHVSRSDPVKKMFC
jgi:hypothetical protein